MGNDLDAWVETGGEAVDEQIDELAVWVASKSRL